MFNAAAVGFALEYPLDTLKELPADQWLMYTLEGLVRELNADQARVERIPEQFRQAVRV